MGHLNETVTRYHERMHPDHLGSTPATISPELLAFRRMLHDEEVREVAEAWTAVDQPMRSEDRAELIGHLLHELADVVIVAYGTAAYMGLDLDDVITAVMRANMRKVPPTVPGGKATKPAGWCPADETIVELVRRVDQPAPVPAPFAQPVAPGRLPVRYDLSYGPVFTAGFTSTCGGCLDELEEGDEARMMEGEAMHRSCAEESGK